MDWKLVPKKITEEMEEGFFRAHAHATTIFAEGQAWWDAVLEAAPVYPSAEVPETADAAIKAWREDLKLLNEAEEENERLRSALKALLDCPVIREGVPADPELDEDTDKAVSYATEVFNASEAKRNED